MIMDTDTFSYRYKGEKGKKRMGLITEHSSDKMGVTPDGKHLDVGRTMGLLTVATKALAKKVDVLEHQKKRR